MPEAWFAALARDAFPCATHVFVSASPQALDELSEAGPFDWVAGYSLGTLLLLEEAERAARLGRVALLAPIFAFPSEANVGGKVSRAQVRQLARQVRRDPRVAVADFYERAGLDVPAEAAASPEVENLIWGLERLENDRVAPALPEGWLAWCGAEDALLDAKAMNAIEPRVSVVEGGTHHPMALLREFAAIIT